MNATTSFTILLCTYLLLPLSLIGQGDDSFRVDCQWVATYDQDKEEWGEWKEGDNTFIFNYNEGKDIKVFYASGKSILFRNLGYKQTGETKDGTAYESLLVLADYGQKARIVLYSNHLIVLFYDDIWIRFSSD